MLMVREEEPSDCLSETELHPLEFAKSSAALDKQLTGTDIGGIVWPRH